MRVDPETETTLLLLNEIEQNEFHSQRSLSSQLGIALGLTIAYIRRCLRKGWIKMSRTPARRYAYYLTPSGFAEKSRLTAEYLARSFHFFRDARAQCLEGLRACECEGRRRVILVGYSELAEIAVFATRECSVTLAGLVAPGYDRQKFHGIRVIEDLEEAPVFDAVLITDISNPQRVFENMKERFDPEIIFTPTLLHISRTATSQPVE